jgi:integrase
MSVSDPNQYVKKYRNTRQQVKDADIAERDREQLLAFGEAKFDTNKASTAKANLFSALQVARLAVANDLPPLTEWEQTDYTNFAARLARSDLDGVPDGGYSENYRRSLKQHTKNFFEFLNRNWHDEITVGTAPESPVTRDDLISQDELAALFGAAEHPRDQCLLVLPLATFQRNAALRALRISDVNLTDSPQTAYIQLNTDARGQKRASGKRPLTFATTYVKKWLEVHPRKDDPEAPLLCVISDSGNANRGAALAKDDSYNNRLRTLAERAGLDKERYTSSIGRREATIRAHLLRHTAITRAGRSEQFSDQIIKRWAGWTEDSNRLRDYVHLSDEDLLTAAQTAYGGAEEDELAGRPKPGECERCGHPTEEWMRACPRCSLLLSPEAGALSDSLDNLRGDIAEAGFETTDAEMIELLKMLRKTTDNPAALRKAVEAARDE